MPKPFRKILLIYKKSAYSIYFLERRIKLAKKEIANLKNEMVRFKKAHDEHYSTVEHVEKVLKKYGLRYDKRTRGAAIPYKRYDLIVTLGGDGSFLEAAKNVKDQVMLGVNSAPSFSIGKLCMVNRANFERIVQRIIKGRYTVCQWPRLRLKVDNHARAIDCVNDCLIAHSNPAAVSRYRLKIGRIKEEQRNSGLWISTAAGSSGAIKSAGGKVYGPEERLIQYMPRELYYGFSKSYKLKGGVLRKQNKIIVTSLMHKGMIFADGMHINLKFPFNAKLTVTLSPDPIRMIKFK